MDGQIRGGCEDPQRWWRVWKRVVFVNKVHEVLLADSREYASAAIIQGYFRGWFTRNEVGAHRAAGVDSSTVYLFSIWYLRGALHGVACDSRSRDWPLLDKLLERIRAAFRRQGIARLLEQDKKASSARMQHARKAAAEAKWRALKEDRDRQCANSSIEQIGRAHYYVPDSKRGQLEYHAALRTHILGYDWLSGGSGPEGEWDDELDDPRTWAD